MAELLCLNAVYGIGAPCEQLSPITVPQGLLLAKRGFSFTDGEDFADSAEVLAGIAAGSLFPIMEADSYEAQSSEDRIHTTGIGKKLFLGEGIPGMRVLFSLTKDQHKIARTYNNKKWDLFIIDRNNNILGIKNDDLTITGIQLDYFHVGKQMPATDADPEFTPIEFQYLDAEELDKKGVYVNPVWRAATTIKPATLVTLTQVGTVATFAFVVDVAYKPSQQFSPDGTAVSIPITDLTTAGNWKVIDQGGAVETVTAVESTTIPGRYTVTGVDITAGTVQVIATAADLFQSDILTLATA
jgi:hypothetical protein